MANISIPGGEIAQLPEVIQGARPGEGVDLAGTAVGTVTADLPALRPDELAVLLGRAARHERSFVRDAQGTGTTLLLALDADHFRPMFGAGSAERHAHSGAVEIAADRLPSVRRDVDTAADLDAALTLGVGSWTSRVLDGLGSRSQAG